MVNKSSFFDKLVSRFRSSSGVRVGAGHHRRGHRGKSGTGTGTGSQGHAQTEAETLEARTEQDPGSVSGSESGSSRVPARHRGEARSSRKISSREDAVITMNESFGEMCSLLRGVQVRLEDQGGQMAKVGEHTRNLPAASQAQQEVLRSLVLQMEKQNQVQDSMSRAFTQLPEVMEGLKSALDRAAATDKRTVETLGDFRATMDRIQDGMGRMVESARTQAESSRVLARDQKASAEKLVEHLNEERAQHGEVQKATVRELENTTQEGLRALRWAQEDQANRMVKLVGEAGRLNRVVVGLLIMSLVVLAGILVAILAG